ncbi:MAG: hypothetical protein JWO18_2432 [Microbacteriaceae bacterium]|jgi:hypothetical protein|nr:hypothetical protein [Microbacteriaceae bacterium]
MADENGTGENTAGDETDALLSRLRLIEDQPLDQRAPAFAQIHDRLQSILEGGDAPQQHG